MLTDAGAEWMRFGADDDAVEIVATFGPYEAEYAAIRKGVGILPMPQRAVIQTSGADVKDFLHRMVTQDINAMTGGASRRAFMLNEKGRIIADLYVHFGDVGTWLECDRCDVVDVMAALDKRLFAEDVKIEDWRDKREAIALHGPQAIELLRAVSGGSVMEDAGIHQVIDIAGAAVSVARREETGSPGWMLFVDPDAIEAVMQKLAEAVGGFTPEVEGGVKRAITGRGIGWAAYNTARVEQGWPLFHVDFGTDCLPHETALLKQTTSFTKGCYIGQEVVARMQSLGHPKRMLTALQFADDHLPIAGSQVLDGGDVVGAVTSSTLSPMRGNTAVAIAMMKWGKHVDGTEVEVAADGEMVKATVKALAG